MILFIDSFDHYNTAGLALKYFASPASGSISAVSPRTGLQDLLIIGAFGPTIAVASLPHLIFGTALRPNILDPTFTGDFVRFRDMATGTEQIRVGLTPAGAIQIRRGNDPFSTVLATSAVGLVPTGSYSYLEVEVTISNAAGSVEVRLNEASVLSFAGDTQASANAFVTGVQLMSAGGGGQWRHDDIYLLDADTAPNNSFLGAVQVFMLVPNADAAPLQWTPSAGVNHFDLVDEVPQSTADYVESSTAAQIDQYLYDTSPITPPVTVLAVQHSMLAGLDAAGAHDLGSSIDGAAAASDEALTTTARYNVTPYDQKAGVDWTLVSIAATSFGPQLTT
jgi:hypothetical protein